MSIFRMLPGHIRVRHEHSARYLSKQGGLPVLLDDIESYTRLGFTLIRRTDETAFLFRGEDNLELIPQGDGWLEHEAFVVQTFDDLEVLKQVMDEAETPEEAGVFSLVESSPRMTQEFEWHMYCHVHTNKMIQIIWRKNNLFPNINFDKIRMDV